MATGIDHDHGRPMRVYCDGTVAVAGDADWGVDCNSDVDCGDVDVDGLGDGFGHLSACFARPYLERSFDRATVGTAGTVTVAAYHCLTSSQAADIT